MLRAYGDKRLGQSRLVIGWASDACPGAQQGVVEGLVEQAENSSAAAGSGFDQETRGGRAGKPGQLLSSEVPSAESLHGGLPEFQGQPGRLRKCQRSQCRIRRDISHRGDALEVLAHRGIDRGRERQGRRVGGALVVQAVRAGGQPGNQEVTVR